MPFKPKQSYSPVPNNEYDLRIPLHTEESFQHGIVFQAKYIGSLDVPRPNNRMEIVAAMRRIRYEFKAKGMKKKKVTIEVSVEGVKVAIVKRKTKKKDWPTDDASLLLMQHPIYRIFYVSHDSQDLKIFSYIARDASSNLFRCNVFKTVKKSQAMKIVRTVGQAFEVCHKLANPSQNTSSLSSATQEDEDVDNEEDESQDEEEEQEEEAVPEVVPVPEATKKATEPSDLEQQPVEVLSVEVPAPAKVLDVTPCGTLERPRIEPAAQQQLQQQLHMLQQQQQRVQESQNSAVTSTPTSTGSGSTPLARQHEVLLLRQQLEQQQQQTQAALAQVKLLKDQLAAETAARMEAQARTHQLLIHNKELLDHIQTLVMQMQELESKVVPAVPPPPSSIPQLPLTARIMEWLQLQPISRQESGFVEETAEDCDEVDVMVDEARRRFYDATRRSLPASVRSRSKHGRRWKFLSRKSSWRSL